MPTIKNIIVKNMRRITLLMVCIILLLSTLMQLISEQRIASQRAEQIFGQVGQILEENSLELERVRAEYKATCLNDARTAAYILEYNPAARDDLAELKKIAADLEVDEIHIFNKQGVIVAGTHPEYFNYSFDSGDQMGFFKPLLNDKTLELVQNITPNTAEGKMVQYSALWSEDGEFIVQIGMYPDNVLRATQKNELSYIFSLLRTGVDYSLYAVDAESGIIVGSTMVEDVDKSFADIGLRAEKLQLTGGFYSEINQTPSYCRVQRIGDNYIVWSTPLAKVFKATFAHEFSLLVGLVMLVVIMVLVVINNMNRTVIDQIKRINVKLRNIQDGDLNTEVRVEDSREFLELSAHINSMVESLLQNSEKLELSEQIKKQKEALERQREQLEVAVERAETACKAKSDFLFNMSHDIRTPMNAIIGFTNLALESKDLNALREYLKNIDISSKQLQDLLNNVLEFSRIENKKVNIEEDLLDVAESCRKLCAIFDGELQEKGLNCQIKMDINHPYMYFDTPHYSQIFINIVSNSIKYTPEGGKIAITFRELPGDRQDYCWLETVVEDSGIGMSEEFLARAYEAFSRERSSTMSGVCGTGLGLAIVKELVDMMHGTINIESQQGKGTKTTIRLPLRLGEAPEVKKTEEAVDTSRLTGKRILLTEDIDMNAIIATKMLVSKGCIIERARDGVECVDMLLKAEPGYYDLVLMDIQMPNMDGYKATQTIRSFADRQKAGVPILAMTANAFKEDVEKAFACGMNGHIAKPLDAVKMFKTIMEVF